MSQRGYKDVARGRIGATTGGCPNPDLGRRWLTGLAHRKDGTRGAGRMLCNKKMAAAMLQLAADRNFSGDSDEPGESDKDRRLVTLVLPVPRHVRSGFAALSSSPSREFGRQVFVGAFAVPGLGPGQVGRSTRLVVTVYKALRVHLQYHFAGGDPGLMPRLWLWSINERHSLGLANFFNHSESVKDDMLAFADACEPKAAGVLSFCRARDGSISVVASEGSGVRVLLLCSSRRAFEDAVATVRLILGNCGYDSTLCTALRAEKLASGGKFVCGTVPCAVFRTKLCSKAAEEEEEEEEEEERTLTR